MQFRAYGLGFRVQHLAVWGLGFIGLLSMGRLGAQEAPYILNTHIKSYGTLEKYKFLNKNPVKQTLTSKKNLLRMQGRGSEKSSIQVVYLGIRVWEVGF